MAPASLTSIPARMARRWAAMVLLLIGLFFMAFACGGEEEVFFGEPSGLIAFVSDRDGNNEIYVMAADGSGQENLTNDEAGDSEPGWSPDGTRIAFSSFRTGPANLYFMMADGTGVEQLTEAPSVDGGARWSPDGSQIAFYTFRNQSRQLMWIMDLDTGALTPVLEDQVPGPETVCSGGFPGSWYPDGEHILFRGSQGEIRALQICSVALDGSDTEVIFSESATFSYFPSLSPDGSKIAFTSDLDDNAEIYIMNADGGSVRRLTETGYEPAREEDEAGPDTCDDGIDNGEDGTTDEVDADCSVLNEYPTWSPDGQWIAFHSDRDGDFEIYIMRPNGTDLRQLTDNDSDDTSPAWAP